MIVALHSEIRAGHVEDYLTRHERIPEELAATFARIGVHDWSIYRSGLRLFHLVDCDDWDAAQAALAADPADARWQADIGRFVELFRTADGEPGVGPLQLVWQLSDQER